MAETQVAQNGLPNLVTILAGKAVDPAVSHFINIWGNIIFSLIVTFAILLIVYYGTRRRALIPNRMQSFVEIIVSGIDDFVCGILGSKGRRYTPFIGSLFICIILMNLFGLIPLFKAPTSSWSVTLALALCVFFYVQYSAFKELGFFGYVDHFMEKPRGFLAWTVVIPLLMFFLGIISELVKPISLSLRLRSNIWGDEVLYAILAGFGLKGLPLLVFNTFLNIIGSVVQAVVFCLLTTIYFSLVLSEEEH